MKYSEPRYTKDLDVWVHNSRQNALRVVEALKKFGAPLDHDKITSETFAEKQVVYQIGIAPVRIDILTDITGVRFPDAWTTLRPHRTGPLDRNDPLRKLIVRCCSYSR